MRTVSSLVAAMAVCGVVALGAGCASKSYVAPKQEMKTPAKPRVDFSNVTPGALNQHREAMDLFTNGDYEGAARHWREALKAGARDVTFQYEVNYNLGVTFQKMEKYILSEQHFRKAIALDDKNARGYIGLGTALSFQGRQGEAVPMFRRALELAPGSPEAYAGIAAMAVSSGDYANAVDALRFAASASPSDATLRDSLIGAYVGLASGRVAAGNLDAAQELYGMAAALGPTDPRPLYGAAFVMMRRGYPGRAKPLYAQARDLQPSRRPDWDDLVPGFDGKPDTTEALRAESMARLFRDRGDYERAAEQYTLLLALDPWRAEIWREYADLAMDKLNDPKRAGDAVHALWVLDPKDAKATDIALRLGQNAPDLPKAGQPSLLWSKVGSAISLDGKGVSGDAASLKAGTRISRQARIGGVGGKHLIEARLIGPKGETARSDRFEIDVVTPEFTLTVFDTLPVAGAWKQEWSVDGKVVGGVSFELQAP